MNAKFLVPVAVMEGQTVGQGVVNLLADEEVVLLGYHAIPEQTSPDQARDSFGEKAREKLDDIADAFETAGADVESILAFTHDREQTFERVADENDCDTLLRLNPAMDVERILVSLYGDVDPEPIGRVAAELADGTDVELHLHEVVGEGDPSALLDPARETLTDHGIDPDRITGEVVETDRPVAEIVEAAIGYDAIVLGEKAPSLSEIVLGDFEERIAEGSLGPVFVVRSCGD